MADENTVLHVKKMNSVPILDYENYKEYMRSKGSQSHEWIWELLTILHLELEATTINIFMITMNVLNDTDNNVKGVAHSYKHTENLQPPSALWSFTVEKKNL